MAIVRRSRRSTVVERGALHPSLAAADDAALYAQITVVGGAYHEVRRIFAALGSHVLTLCRTAFGRLALAARSGRPAPTSTSTCRRSDSEGPTPSPTARDGTLAAMQPGSPRVLIFGATSAIAAEVARLYAGARRAALPGRAQPRQAGAAWLPRRGRQAAGAVVGTRAADLDDTAAAAGLVAGGIAALGGLDVAIVAQGLLGDQLATERDYAEAERVIRTNFLSVVALLIPLANHLEAQGRGSIGVMSSVAGDRGRPRNFTYGAAKGALNVYLQGLRTRLGPRGVGVHTFKIGPVDTPMTVDHRKTAVFARAADVAGGILATIDHGRGEAYLPWFWRPIMAVVRSMPEPALRRLPFLAGR